MYLKSAFSELHIYCCNSMCNDSKYMHDPMAQSSGGTYRHHSCANKPRSPAGRSGMKRAVSLSYAVLELGAEIPARAKSHREAAQGSRSLEKGSGGRKNGTKMCHSTSPEQPAHGSANMHGFVPDLRLPLPRTGGVEKMGRKGQIQLLQRALKSKSCWAGPFGFQHEHISNPALLVRVCITASSRDTVLSCHQRFWFR